MRRWLVLYALITSLGLGEGVLRERDHLLSVPPRPATAGAARPKQRPSSLSLQVTIPLSLVQGVADANIPRQFPVSGRERVKVPVKKWATQYVERQVQLSGDIGNFLNRVTRVVVQTIMEPVQVLTTVVLENDADYHLMLSRGSIALESRGAEITATVPITGSGKVGYVGAVAEALGAHSKNARAAGTATLKASLSLSEKYELQLAVGITHEWTDKPKIELMERWWEEVTGKVDESVVPKLREIEQIIRSAVPPSILRDELVKLWGPQRILIPVDGSAEVLVSILPTSLGFSGLNFSGDECTFTFNTDGFINVGLAGGTSEQTPAREALPPLKKIEPVAPPFVANVHLGVQYSQLETVLRKNLKGQAVEADTPVGKGSILVREVSVYPAEDGMIAVGMDVKARFKWRPWQNTSGVIYVVGVPVFDDSTRELRLTQVRFTRILDNKLWSYASALFQNQIRNAIEGSAKVSFAETIAQGEQAITQAVAKLNSGGKFAATLSPLKLSIPEFVLTKDSVAALAVLEGKAAVTVKKLDLKPALPGAQ